MSRTLPPAYGRASTSDSQPHLVLAADATTKLAARLSFIGSIRSAVESGRGSVPQRATSALVSGHAGRGADGGPADRIWGSSVRASSRCHATHWITDDPCYPGPPTGFRDSLESLILSGPRIHRRWKDIHDRDSRDPRDRAARPHAARADRDAQDRARAGACAPVGRLRLQRGAGQP